MKKYNIIGACLLSLFMFVACTDDTDPGYVKNTNASAPSFTDPSDGKSYVLLDGTQTNTFEVYKWEPADYGIAVGQRFTVQLDTLGGEFVKPVNLVITSERSARFTVEQINSAILGFGIEEAAPVKLQLRILANAMGGEEGSLELLDFPKIASTPINLTVTPFVADVGYSYLFLVGSVLGSKSWDNANYEYVFFKDNSENDNKTFVYPANMIVGGFKMIEPPLGSWDNQYGLSDGKIVYKDGGSSDIPVAVNGYQKIIFNQEALTYSIDPFDASGATTYAKISLIGDAVGGWDVSNDVMMTQTDYDPHIWIADNVELQAKEVKFRVDQDWVVSWGVGGQFPYGIGNLGGDNISVAKAGNYFVKFNDITGHYVFYLK